MGDFEHKPGSGSIFENGYKETDRQPDMKGKIKTPDGQEWDVSGWWKESRNGQFLSLAIQEPWQGGRGSSTRSSQPVRPSERPSGRPMTDEEFEAERARRSSGYGSAGGQRAARGGASGSGYGQTQRPVSPRPGEVAGHSLPPMDDFADDDIPF